MPSKPDKPALTRRQVNNLRAESMRWASYMLARLRMSVLGEPAMTPCPGCGREYELFPHQPEVRLSGPQVLAAKYEIDKVYPSLAADDLDSATETPKTREEIAASLAMMLCDPGVVDLLIATRPDVCRALRDRLDHAPALRVVYEAASSI